MNEEKIKSAVGPFLIGCLVGDGIVAMIIVIACIQFIAFAAGFVSAMGGAPVVLPPRLATFFPTVRWGCIVFNYLSEEAKDGE